MSDTETTEAKPSGPKKPKGPLLLAAVNTLAGLGLLGILVYTQVLYKRPPITEKAEREKLAKLHAKAPAQATTPGLVKFDAFTANIAPIPEQPRAANGTANQMQGKPHFVTLSFSLEVRDISKQDLINSLKPALMDRILGLLGRSDFHELTTVQGRYVLRTRIIEITNQLILQASPPKPNETEPEALVKNVFFTDFIVQ